MISAVRGNTFVLKFLIRRVRIARSFYFAILSAPNLIPFLSPEIAMSINRKVPLSLWGIMVSRLLLWMDLSVCSC
jgi:hypothetical protein